MLARRIDGLDALLRSRAACSRSTSASDRRDRLARRCWPARSRRSRASPSATGTFLPLSRPPPKVVRMLRGWAAAGLRRRPACRSPCRPPARAAISSSAPRSPRASALRSPARPSVSNGTGAATRPISSATTQSSSGDRPSPPYSSGMADARHAKLDQALPDLVGVGFVAVEHAAHDFHRALVGEEFANLLLEQLLVVGKIEVHDGREPSKRVRSGERLQVPSGGRCDVVG